MVVVESGGCCKHSAQPPSPDSTSPLRRHQTAAEAPPSRGRHARYDRPRPRHLPRSKYLQPIVMTTHSYRVVTVDTICARFFPGRARSFPQRLMTAAWRAGFLDKLRDRPVNRPDVYFLSASAPRGLALLQDVLGDDAAHGRFKRPPAIDHALALNDFRARLEHSAELSGLSVDAWKDELDLAELASEGLVPDASFQLTRPEGARAGFLVEAELTHVSRRHWRVRLGRYAQFYYARQKYEAFFGLRSLRLLVITDGLRLSILEEAERLEFTPLRLTTWAQVREASPGELLFAPIWRKPSAPGLIPLYVRTGGEPVTVAPTMPETHDREN